VRTRSFLASCPALLSSSSRKARGGSDGQDQKVHCCLDDGTGWRYIYSAWFTRFRCGKVAGFNLSKDMLPLY
jgi:hypothetical protein